MTQVSFFLFLLSFFFERTLLFFLLLSRFFWSFHSSTFVPFFLSFDLLCEEEYFKFHQLPLKPTEEGYLELKDFADNSIDMCVASQSLHHVIDQERMLKDIARVVQPGKRGKN